MAARAVNDASWSPTRRVGVRKLRKRFLIVCEGEKTEPNYFKKFRTTSEVIVVGTGCNTKSLVKEAVRLRAKDEYDEVWCVFDRDSFEVSAIKAAFALATKSEISIAFSNEAFELWYLLHFDYMDTQISRTQYAKLLTTRLEQKYKKNDSTMFDKLLSKQKTAIRNAKKLYAAVCEHDKNLHDAAPCTTVWRLVDILLKDEQAASK